MLPWQRFGWPFTDVLLLSFMNYLGIVHLRTRNSLKTARNAVERMELKKEEQKKTQTIKYSNLCEELNATNQLTSILWYQPFCLQLVRFATCILLNHTDSSNQNLFSKTVLEKQITQSSRKQTDLTEYLRSLLFCLQEFFSPRLFLFFFRRFQSSASSGVQKLSVSYASLMKS